MTTERHSPEWLIENADHGIAFEVACASALTRLLAANAELQQQLEAIGAGGVGPLIPTTVQHQGESSGDNELQRKTGDLITTAAPPQSGGIPPDWKPVPLEPTDEMLQAFKRRYKEGDFWRARITGAVCAMLAAAPQPPGGQEPDWQDLYRKEKRRAEMWIAKYEKDIGKLQVAVPVAARPPSVAARTCANCLHNKPPFGNCDGCSQQNDDADDEGNWEPIPEPQGEQEPAYLLRDLAADIGVNAMDLIAAIRDAGLGSYSINMMLPTRVCVAMCQKFAVAPQHEPLKEHEIEAALSRVNRCALTPKGIRIAEARAIERAHGIGGDA